MRTVLILLLVALSANAQMAVMVSPVKTMRPKAVVPLGMQNNLATAARFLSTFCEARRAGLTLREVWDRYRLLA